MDAVRPFESKAPRERHRPSDDKDLQHSLLAVEMGRELGNWRASEADIKLHSKPPESGNPPHVGEYCHDEESQTDGVILVRGLHASSRLAAGDSWIELQSLRRPRHREDLLAESKQCTHDEISHDLSSEDQ